MYTDVPATEPYDLIARESWVSDGSDVDVSEKRETLLVLFLLRLHFHVLFVKYYTLKYFFTCILSSLKSSGLNKSVDSTRKKHNIKSVRIPLYKIEVLRSRKSFNKRSQFHQILKNEK